MSEFESTGEHQPIGPDARLVDETSDPLLESGGDGPSMEAETGAAAEAKAEVAGLGEDAGEPLGLEVAETGHSGVDGALARLGELDGVPTEAHAGVYEDVHERLRETLAALDRAPGPPPPAAAQTHRS